MPTPVSTARQCLTEEAARALDDAVAVAIRRSHQQTTSLHAVSALLALPSSTLREACCRARSSDYSPRLQFRALELCVSVSLDRLPTSKSTDEPPVSNSLMAAIKRSQANQRRQPETFHLYQQMQLQNQLAISCVKVELKFFILSILDDPIVSRVFEEAGFRGSDIKLAILHPPPISRFSPSRVPPLFLCSLDAGSNSSRFNFPFSGFPEIGNGDENFRRIGEVLVKKKGKNPLLIGVCANDALGDFTEFVKRGKASELAGEIEGLGVACIGEEIVEFVVNGGSKEMMDLKFKEVSDRVESCSGCGVAVNYGELKVFVDGGSVDEINYVVSRLSSLVVINGGRLWLIGAAASDDTYRRFLGRFPSVEKDWDLCVLPITSSKSSTGGSYSKSSLMMGSFVPFGGFFPTPSELKSPPSSTRQSITRCDHCNEKYEQAASLILKGGSTTSVADHHSAGLPFWLQKDDSTTIEKTNVLEANDGGTVLNARLTGLQRKWNDICERLHRTRSLQQNMPHVGSHFLGFEGSQFGADKKQANDKDSLPKESSSINLSSCIPLDVQKVSPARQNLPISSSSITLVTTDLGLGTLYASPQEDPRKFKFQDHKDRLQSFSGSAFPEINRVSKVGSSCIANDGLQSFSGSVYGEVNRVSKNASNCGDEKDFKYLWRVLAEKVGWQDEAICTISQTVSRCRSGNGRRSGANHRRDIWLGFLGPDKVGKKIIAEELAEIVFGSRENLISVDLSSEEDANGDSNTIFRHQGLNSYDVKFRGKTVVDYIAEELRRKPNPVVFLENIDKADFVAQNCLSRAIQTGKFQDSHMREVSINNMIFVTTSSIVKVDKEFVSGKDPPEFSEERILGAKCLQMQILVERVTGHDVPRTSGSNVFLTPRKGNKRKLINMRDSVERERSLEKPKRACLDLNLPVEEIEEEENDYGNCDSDSSSKNTESFFQDFLDQVDEKVVFKPFDFNSLAEKILKKISLSLRKTIEFDVFLEIDQEVMVQILAADWLSGSKKEVENWVEKVLCRGFVEAHQKHGLKAEHMLKLVFLEDSVLVEEQDPCVCLPARITVK